MQSEVTQLFTYLKRVSCMLFLACLSGCSGGSGGAGTGFQQLPPPSAKTRMIDQLTAQLADNLAADSTESLRGLVIETDNQLFTLLETEQMIEQFLAKNPVSDFEYLFADQTSTLKLVWLESTDGIDFFVPEPDTAPHGRYFIWGRPSSPAAIEAGFSARRQLDFTLSADLHCTGCSEPHFQLSGVMQLFENRNEGRLQLGDADTIMRLDASLLLDRSGRLTAHPEIIPQLQLEQNPAALTSWQITGQVFGEYAAEAAGGLTLLTDTHQITGGFTGTSEMPAQSHN